MTDPANPTNAANPTDRWLRVPPVWVLHVYLDDSRTYSYELPSYQKAQEHAAAIVKDGYRHCEGCETEFYPAHRIMKVKIVGDPAPLQQITREKSPST